MGDTVKCTDCKVRKPLSGFFKSKYEKYKYNRRCKMCDAIKSKTFQLKPSRCFYRYKKSAKDKGIIFDITFDEFMLFWNKTCSYCNAEIKSIGLDRKDNSKGYTKENILSCCKICNYMKRDLDYQDFIDRCRKVVVNVKNLCHSQVV